MFNKNSLLVLCLVIITVFAAGCRQEKRISAASPSAIIKSLEKKATAGDIEAMLDLGGIFLKGEKVDVNYAEALKWFELAAAKGSVRAKTYCGIILVSGGHGVEQAEQRGVTMIEQAAQHNDQLGQCSLGQYYLGIQQYNLGVPWLEKAAEQGMLAAQMILGDYYGGSLTPRDLDKSLQWYRRAAGQDYVPAMNNLAYLLAIQNKNLDEALALAGKAVETDPENGAYLDTIGWVFFKKGRYHEALARLQQAAKIMPYSEEVQQHLAETYIKLNQKENAVAVLTQILQSSGDIETQKHLREKIYSLNEAAKEKN